MSKNIQSITNGPGPGRPKGSQNKVTKLLRDAIAEAAELAGGKEGLVGYLKKQAIAHPAAFIGLLGKVLPLQVQAQANKELRITLRTIDERAGEIIDVTPALEDKSDKTDA